MNAAQKQKVKAAKDGIREQIKEIRAAEALLADLYEKASPGIGNLIKEAGNPGPHKFRLDSETVVLLTFRKTGEYIPCDKDGKPLGDGKAKPTYGMKETDLSEDQDNE